MTTRKTLRSDVSKRPLSARPTAESSDAQDKLQTAEAELGTYRQRLKLLREATAGLTAELPLERILQNLMETAAQYFHADAVSCTLNDPLLKDWVVVSGQGFTTDYLHVQRQCFQPMDGGCLTQEDYRITPDLRNAANARLSLVKQERVVSELSIAMRMGDRLLGAINFYSQDRPRDFSLEEIEHGRLFAQQAAMVVRNGQLLDELREEVRIANTLLKVAEDIGSLGSLDEVLTRIVGTITRVLNFEVAAVFLWEQDKRFYMPMKETGVPPHRSPFFHTLILHRSDLEFTPEEKKQRSVISFTAMPGRFPVEKLSNVLGYKDLYLVPLVVKANLLGAILCGGYKGESPFDKKDEMFLRGIAAQAAIAIDDSHLFGELEKAFWDTIKSLTAAIEAKDHYTHDHSEAVIEYGTAIAKELNLSPTEQELMRMACLLHDVGKIGIGDEILRKASPLTKEERKAIEKHPIIGEEILSSVHRLSAVSRIVRHHHEHFDGNGYPDRLKGETIPLLSRILLIADSFDAMVSDRPYRKALTREEAVEQLRIYSGRQFDPELVGVFMRVLAKLDAEKHGD